MLATVLGLVALPLVLTNIVLFTGTATTKRKTNFPRVRNASSKACSSNRFTKAACATGGDHGRDERLVDRPVALLATYQLQRQSTAAANAACGARRERKKQMSQREQHYGNQVACAFLARIVIYVTNKSNTYSNMS
jgi:hypothetical protein